LKLFNVWNEEEIKYWFLPRKDVIYSYVVENSEKIITDFVSFYCLPSSVLKHEKHKDLRAAYSYYNVSTVTPLKVHHYLLLFKIIIWSVWL
jgi:glycylpeptide N-tetradecanoyltransferase